jgi:hypothetical protein
MRTINYLPTHCVCTSIVDLIGLILIKYNTIFNDHKFQVLFYESLLFLITFIA